jgi:hypothetical protein
MCNCWEQVSAVLKIVVPLGLWVVFWLCAVNWQKTWPVLAAGGWAPLVLLVLVSAAVWSRLDSAPCTALKFVSIPTFWWQLGAVGGLTALALFCGWVQQTMGWTPPEYAVEPPPAEDHGHAHGHDHH